MVVEERRRLEMFERLTEVVGVEVAETLLAHLPPSGEQVATAAQIDRLREETTGQIDRLREETTGQIDRLRDETTGQIDRLREEIGRLEQQMQHRFTSQESRLAALWRRDLLVLAVPQFLVLLGIILSLHL